MDFTKPHKGTIDQYWKESFGDVYRYWGTFLDHPDLNGKQAHTSMILKEEGNEIETLNSRYTLGKPLDRGLGFRII